MKRIALLALCVVGLLVVFAFLAVSAYASYITTASPAAVLNHPAPVNGGVTTDRSTLSSATMDSGEPVEIPVHRIGSACDADRGTTSTSGY